MSNQSFYNYLLRTAGVMTDMSGGYAVITSFALDAKHGMIIWFAAWFFDDGTQGPSTFGGISIEADFSFRTPFGMGTTVWNDIVIKDRYYSKQPSLLLSASDIFVRS